MELNYDWRCFQSMFYPKGRSIDPAGQEVSPVYVVVEDEGIVSAYGEGDDFSPWVGRTYLEMAQEISHRELILFQRKDVDQWTQEALALPHFYDQVEFLRAKAAPQVLSRSRLKRGSQALTLKQGGALPVHRHFLLEALQGWWAKVLPSSFGLFIRLESGEKGEKHEDLFMIVRRGRVDLFCEPELSTVPMDRGKPELNIIKHLAERHLVPVQGLFVLAEEWESWSESTNPWRQVANAIRSEEAQLVPFRWGPATLVATRGILGI